MIAEDTKLSLILQYQIKSNIDIMRRPHNQTTQIHECAFEALIYHTNAAVKFSCKMFVAWKNTSNKTFCKTLNDNVVVKDGIATFNENLSFQTYLLYDKTTEKYLKKQTSLCLLLVSARKPEEEKLVGRVIVDLAQVLNENVFSQKSDHKLAFCSIANATITFNIKLLSNIKTDIKPMDLDMDQFSIIQRSLNQSTNSNNDDLLAFKNIGKDISQEIDAQKQPSIVTKQINQQVHPSKEKNQNLPIIQMKIQDQQKNIKVAAKGQFAQIDEAKAFHISNTQDLKINTTLPTQKQDVSQKLSKFQVVVQTPKSLITNNDQVLISLKQNNKKLQDQNYKLIQMFEKINTQLSEQKNLAEDWKNKYQLFQIEFNKSQDQKNDVIQQLLSQVQESSRKYIELQRKLKIYNQSGSQLQKLKQRLRNTTNLFEQSQKLRLDIESELLQIRFQLSELKTDKQTLQTQLRMKQEQLDKLYKFTEDMRSSSKYQQQIDKSLYKSLSMLSDRERTCYNEQIEALKRKMNKLVKQLQFTQNVKQKLQMFNKECEELTVEKDNLLTQLNNIRQQRQLWINNQKIEQVPENFQNNINNVEVELKAVEAELNKYENQKFHLQQKIQALQQQNLLIRKILQLKQGELNKASQIVQLLQNQNSKKIPNVQQKQKVDIQQQNQRLRQLQNNLQNVENQLYKRNNQIRQLHNRELQLEQKYSKTEQIKTQFQNRLKQLQINYQVIIQEKSDLSNKLLHLQQQLQAVRKQNIEIKTKEVEIRNQIITSNSSQISQLKGLNVQMKKQIEQYEQNTKKITDQFQKSKLNQQKLELNRKNTQISLQKLSLQNNANQTKILTLESENNKLKQKNTELQNKIVKIQKQFISYKQQLNNLNKTSKETANKTQKSLADKDIILKNKQKQITDLKEKLDGQTQKIQQLQDRISRFAQKQLKMRQNILILEQQSRKIYDIVVDKQQNQEFQAMALQQKQNQIQNLKAQLQQKSTLCQIANQELTQYKKQLYDLKKQAINKRIQQQGFQNSHEKAINIENYTQQRYNELLKLSNQRISQLESEMNHNEYMRERQINNLKSNIGILQNELGNQKRKVYNLEQNRMALREQRSQLQNKIQSYENTLRFQKNQLNQALEQLQKSKQVQTRATSLQEVQILLNLEMQNKQNEIARLTNQIKDMEFQLKLKTEKQIQTMRQKQATDLTSNQANLQKKIKELTSENQMMESQLNNQELTISQYKQQVVKANHTINTLKCQIEDSQVQKMNAELQKQFPPAKDKSRTQSQQLKKSGNLPTNIFTQQFINACKCLQELLQQRTEKDKAESILQMLVSKNAMMEEELNKVTEQRGLIQENARKLSMEFQKIKSKILKGKGSFQEKNQLLGSLKPFELKVKDLVELTQRLSDAQLQNQNF